jgi:hypothetical protein
MQTIHPLDLLIQKQRSGFLLNGSPLTSEKQAEKFLKSVGMTLRYWGSETLPLASLYQAVWGSADSPPHKEKDEPQKINLREETIRKGIGMANHLLSLHLGIEVNVIANRLVLIHRDLVPSLYVLVRRHRPVSDLTTVSVQAKRVFQLIEQNKGTTVGQVRKFLGLRSKDPAEDPAYLAVSELQSEMLIDRGPFIMREKGIPYLSKEGYPYHCFHLVHNDLALASAKLTREEATKVFLSGYLSGAVFATGKKLFSLFKTFLTRSEIDASVDYLLKKNKVFIEKIKRDDVIVFKK